MHGNYIAFLQVGINRNRINFAIHDQDHFFILTSNSYFFYYWKVISKATVKR